jgi:hypothetical protein
MVGGSNGTGRGHMTDETTQTIRGISRRKLLGYGIAGLGAAAVGVASPALTGTALAASQQVQWLWCSRCQGLWYGANETSGSCIATGAGHVITTTDTYVLSYNTGSGSNLQANWNWCGYCQGLFYGPHQSTSDCPYWFNTYADYNVPHNYEVDTTYNYGLQHDLSGLNGNTNPQGDWNWCNKCQGLFYGPHQSTSVCPKPNPNGSFGTHNGSGSYSYDLPFNGSFSV